MVWLSLSARVLVNVEALNMVESIGNYTRHRRAPMVIYDEKSGYTIKFVPAISGESLAHAYQMHLVKLAEKLGLPVCERCANGEFVKRGVEAHRPKDFKQAPRDIESAHKFEKAVIKECVVEDIGGFLHPFGDVPVKRTSCIYFGYMIPALDTKASALEPEFHVRHSPAVRREERAQMIYYVEVGSAVYVISSALDVSRIGLTSMIKREPVIDEKEKLRRVEAAITALYLTVGQGLFGAKLTRFLPDYEVLSMVIAVSRDLPFNVKSGHKKTYIQDTARSAEAFSRMTGSDVRVITYISSIEEEELKRAGLKVPENVIRASTVDEAFELTKKIVLEEYRDFLMK